jgi:hypothetical protein
VAQQTPHRRRASLAVSAWLSHHERNPAWLARQTEADPGTIGTFLSGSTWPKLKTQGRIEKALGWPAGTLTAIADGAEPPPLDGGSALQDPVVGGDTQDAQQFVESLTGERLQSGVTNEDLLREILRSRSEADRMAGRIESVESGLGALSERVAKLEESGA